MLTQYPKDLLSDASYTNSESFERIFTQGRKSWSTYFLLDNSENYIALINTRKTSDGDTLDSGFDSDI